MEELSDFEKQRLANIAERDNLLKKLTQNAQASGVGLPPRPKAKNPLRDSPSSSNKNKKKAAVPKIKEEEPAGPRRTSSRLRGIAAESEVAKRKADDDYEAFQEAERAKRVRKSDAFSFEDMVVSGGRVEGGSLVGGLGLGLGLGGAEKSYERTFGEEDIKNTTDKDLKALREEMNGLQLWDAWEPNRLKITPERVYTMAFHPSETKPLIFAGDKMGHLGVLDASQKPVKKEDDNDDDEEGEDPDPVLTTLKPHTRTISGMHIHPAQPTRLYTASYDSSIREMDLEKSTSVEKYAPTSTAADLPISSLDMAPSDPHVLYWTSLDGEFGRYDTRQAASESTVDLWQLSAKKIGGFSLHPAHPHYLATASLDRTMRLWDLRNLSHDEPVAVGEHESRLSVSHAAFNSAGQIVTSSYDDSLKIYDFGARGIGSWGADKSLSDEEMKPDTIVRHNCQTGRWVTILRPQWQQNPTTTSQIQRFCVGNMNRFVDVYSSAGDQLAQLGGDGITAVPAVAVFHPRRNWVVGGTASGKVCLWM